MKYRLVIINNANYTQAKHTYTQHDRWAVGVQKGGGKRGG